MTDDIGPHRLIPVAADAAATPAATPNTAMTSTPSDDERNTTMTTEHPATTHRRSVAMVAHITRGDAEAAAVLLSEITGPQHAAAQIVSLTGLCRLLLSTVPTEQREQLLNEAALHLAAAEGDPQPPEVA